MRGTKVCGLPIGATLHAGLLANTGTLCERFKCTQDSCIIGVKIIGSPFALGASQFLAERFCLSRRGKMTGLDQIVCQGERLGLPRLIKDRLGWAKWIVRLEQGSFPTNRV